MRQFKVNIEGVAPLRMNKFTDEAKGSLSGGRKKKSKEDTIKEAYERTYKNNKGHYIIPTHAIKASILNGAKKVSLGKGKAKTDMKAVLYVKEDALLNASKPEIIEVVCKIPPKTGALCIKYFVVFKEWKIEFIIIVTDDRFPEIVIQEAIREAGMYAGLLDGRPDFGRFVLTEFKEI